MAYRIDDRWLWLGVGVFFLLAAQGMKYAITDTVRLTELPAECYGCGEEDEQDPEDSISLASLRTLAFSPNHSIAESATSLIISRFASLPGADQLITQDLHSSDLEVQRKARNLVRYLQEWDEELAGKIDGDSSSMHGRDATSMSGRDDLMNEDRTETIVSQLEELALENNPSMGREQAREFAERVRMRYSAERDWAVVHPRPVVVGGAEAERRRRRREAMVLHEGSGSIEEADIIRPRLQ